MSTLARLLSSSLLVAVAGCSGSGGSVSGTVHGQSYSIADAVSSSVSTTNNGVTSNLAVIVMSTTPNLCKDLAAEVTHPNEKIVAIGLGDVNGTTTNTPSAPGTYTIFQGTGSPPPKIASLQAEVQDSNCMAITADTGKATTGTVTLTGVSGNKFSGNYDVALDSGDHITGSFSPEECPQIQTIFTSTTQPTCM